LPLRSTKAQKSLLDDAPTHLLATPDAKPWTYPKAGTPTPGSTYPVERYTDSSDVSLVDDGSFPWLYVVLGIAALGALVGVSGWTLEKLNKRTPPPVAPLSH